MKFPTFWSIWLIASWWCHLSCSSILHISYKLVVRSKVFMTFRFYFFGKMTSHVVLCPTRCTAEKRHITVQLSHQLNLNVQACLHAQLLRQFDSLGFPGGTSGKEPTCQEDPLEKGTANLSSILAGLIPWTEDLACLSL